MADRFTAARLKIERAKKHISDLEVIIESLPDAHICTVERKAELGVQEITYKCADIGERTDEMAIIIGDAIHNIRTALEYAYLGAIERYVPAILDGYTKLPLRKTRAEVESALEARNVHRDSPKLFQTIIAQIKPYGSEDGGDFLLQCIHDLDVEDKHWLLLPTLKVVQIKGLTLQDEYGATGRGDSLPIWGDGPYIIHIKGGQTIKDNGKLAISVVFENIKLLQSVPIPNLLHNFSTLALRAIHLLECV